MLNILKVTSITSKRQNIRFCNTFYYIIYTQQLLFFFYFAAADDDDDICTYIQMYVCILQNYINIRDETYVVIDEI